MGNTFYDALAVYFLFVFFFFIFLFISSSESSSTYYRGIGRRREMEKCRSVGQDLSPPFHSLGQLNFI